MATTKSTVFHFFEKFQIFDGNQSRHRFLPAMYYDSFATVRGTADHVGKILACGTCS